MQEYLNVYNCQHLYMFVYSIYLMPVYSVRSNKLENLDGKLIKIILEQGPKVFKTMKTTEKTKTILESNDGVKEAFAKWLVK